MRSRSRSRCAAAEWSIWMWLPHCRARVCDASLACSSSASSLTPSARLAGRASRRDSCAAAAAMLLRLSRPDSDRLSRPSFTPASRSCRRATSCWYTLLPRSFSSFTSCACAVPAFAALSTGSSAASELLLRGKAGTSPLRTSSTSSASASAHSCAAAGAVELATAAVSQSGPLHRGAVASIAGTDRCSPSPGATRIAGLPYWSC
mmetsp:Transcript_26052/g.67026  ORF Transcript_26052/g.67026 Transcript_26052/m.67026 type:complete len:205 (+) Transcript_26052:426-1040(+)